MTPVTLTSYKNSIFERNMNTTQSQTSSANTVSKLEIRNLLQKAFLPPPTQGRGGNHFPNPYVTAHTGRNYYFHSDLVANKVVMINFMSLGAQAHFPSLHHLAQIAEKLGETLGHDVNIYSITTTPEADSVERLAAYAAEHELPEGWLLLRPATGDSKMLSDRFARHLSRHHHHAGVNMRMVHYGHGGAGVWGAFAVDGDVDMALSRVGWLRPGSLTNSGEIKLAGPAPLMRTSKNANSNRDI